MKKKNILLLSTICVLSLVFLYCLLVYAYEIHKQKEEQNRINKPETVINSEEVPPTLTPLKKETSPSGTANSGITDNAIGQKVTDSENDTAGEVLRHRINPIPSVLIQAE